MRLYHVTSQDSAKIIQKRGFKAKKNGYYGIHDPKTNKPKFQTGVFLSNTILNANDGLLINEPAIFVLDIPEKEISQYEWLNEQGSYREWCIPAVVVNKFFTNRKHYREEDFYDGKDPTK